MKGTAYELLSLTLVMISLVFFFTCTKFLAEKDYLAATLTLFIGFTMVRVSVEMARLAVILRKDE